ncbi:MAG: TIGR03032 family protein [Pseudomonadota bacterium]
MSDEAATANDGQTEAPALSLSASRGFAAWLAGVDGALAFTTYQSGKLFFVGVKDDGGLSIFERSFPRCMGMGRDSKGALWLATLYQIWRFNDFLDPGERRNGHDAYFVPTIGRTTGDLDVHDLHCDGDDAPVFAATRFNCLAAISEEGSFREVWRPPFIDRLAAEDRCHLNGFTMRDGAPAFVTAVATTNIADGWREHRREGGVVIDVASGEIAASGLSMPHSPRWRNGALWLLQSGTGEFGEVDLASGAFEPIAFLPGFARGLSFIGDHAVIGVSKPRRDKTFSGLALDERLEKEGVGARCQIAVVNLKTGDVEHALAIDGVVTELFDTLVLQGVRRPSMLGFKSDEIRFAVRPEPLPPS